MTFSLDYVGDASPDRWRAAAAGDPDASPFQSAAWIGTWAAHQQGGHVIVRDLADGRGAVAEVVESATRRSVAGGRDVTDYRGPVSLPEARASAASDWLTALTRDGVTEVDLHGIATDSGWLDQLDSLGGPLGWSLTQRRAEDVCPRVDLRGETADAWLDRIDGKERHELKRKGRKLARDLGGMQVLEATDHASALARFWDMAVTAEADKGDFFRDDAMRSFFEDALAALAPSGAMRIHELIVGGLPAASMISVVPTDGVPGGRDWCLYNSAFDATLGAFAPGTVLAAELATIAAAEGFAAMDFLRGDEAYKYRFGAVDRPIEQALLVRSDA